MSNIISLPPELLLMVCGDQRLEPIDLKSLRLSHRVFVEIAAERLFRKLSIIFKDTPKSASQKLNSIGPLTTVNQRINDIINGHAIGRFRRCDWRELDLQFHIDQRNGFSTFSGLTCKKLFPLLHNIRKVKIYQDSGRSSGMNYHVIPSLSIGVGDILVALNDQVRTTEKYAAVRELSFTGLEKFTVSLTGFSNLTVLHLHLVAEGESYARPFRPKYDANPIIPETKYDSISKLLVASPLLEVLRLGYFHPHFRGRSELLEGSCFMDSVLERIPTSHELRIRTLVLEWIALPRKIENLAKLKSVKQLHLATYDENSVPKMEEPYNLFQAAGLRPTWLRGGVFLDRGLLEYMSANGTSLEELEIMPLITEPNQDTNEIRELLYQNALPRLSNTLRFLDLHMEIDGLPSISSLQFAFLGQQQSPKSTLNTIMTMLKPCHALVGVKLHLHPEYSSYRAPWWFWESANNRDLFTKQRDEMSRRLPMILRIFSEWKGAKEGECWRNLNKVDVVFEGHEDNMDPSGKKLELSFRLRLYNGTWRFERRDLCRCGILNTK